LLGALVGLFVATRGVGPNSPADIVYHVALIAVLIGGLVVAFRGVPRGQ
jgi:hypothetical protein